MAKYLLQVAYTPEAWAAQLRRPQNRMEIVDALLERLGGRFESAYLSFGEYDLVAVMDLPDNVSAAAAAMVIGSGGAVKALKTTPLLTLEEGMAAMGRGAAAQPHYRPPAEHEQQYTVDPEDPGGH